MKSIKTFCIDGEAAVSIDSFNDDSSNSKLYAVDVYPLDVFKIYASKSTALDVATAYFNRLLRKVKK